MKEWGFVDDRQLARSYSSKACMTCQHFGYGVDVLPHAAGLQSLARPASKR